MTLPPGPARARLGIDAKRVLDVAVSAIALIVVAPLFVLIAAAVRLADRGPAIYRQERVGLHGHLFTMHKFRTMTPDSNGRSITTIDDSRITRVGRVLRALKLDELPQLLDVLLGRMSLVGPRPEVPKYVAMWGEKEREVILSVRPGITDPASILLLNEGHELAGVADPENYYVSKLIPQKTAIYVSYVTSRSFRGDLRILYRTASSLIRRRSAR